MNFIDAFDESEEIVTAKLFTEGQDPLPETAIVCFKQELMDLVAHDSNFKEYSSISQMGEKMKIYQTVQNGKEIILYRTLLGRSCHGSYARRITC